MQQSITLAIAIVFIIEGIMPALFPNKWCIYVRKLSNEPIGTIRSIGMVMIAIGLLICWILF